MKYAFIKDPNYPPLGLGETASLLSCTSATSSDVVPGEGSAFWKTLLASWFATLLVRVLGHLEQARLLILTTFAANLGRLFLCTLAL